MNDISAYLNGNFGRFTGGSLRIFGDWLGWPNDNIHRTRSFSFANDALTITFEQDEELIVGNPQDIVINNDSFIIGKAGHVRWSWYYDDRLKLKENRYSPDYRMTAAGIKTDSNVNWRVQVFSVFESESVVHIGH